MSTNNHDSDQLRKYLSGKMSPEEAHTFERKALDDPFLQEAIDGAESLSATDFQQDVAQINSRINANRSNAVWWRVAASVALLMIGGLSIWMLVDTTPDKLLTQDRAPETEELVSKPDTTASKEVADALEIEEKVVKPMVGKKDQPTEPKATASISENLPEEALLADNRIVEQVNDFSDDIIEEVFVEETEAPSAGSGESAKTDSKPKAAAKRAESTATNQTSHAKAWFSTTSPLRKVKGLVMDDFGEPIPGVNVVVKGTTKGVVTDLDGQYEVVIPEENPTLVYTSVGMQTEEVTVNENSTMDVYLTPDSKELQEVVVTGYGSYDNEPVGYVEAVPVVGLKEYNTYLEEKLFYPENAINQKIEGRVVLQLTISPTGSITDISVKRSLGYGCDEEAIRLIKAGPRWSPATKDGLNVETKVRVRVKFELD